MIAFNQNITLWWMCNGTVCITNSNAIWLLSTQHPRHGFPASSDIERIGFQYWSTSSCILIVTWLSIRNWFSAQNDAFLLYRGLVKATISDDFHVALIRILWSARSGIDRWLLKKKIQNNYSSDLKQHSWRDLLYKYDFAVYAELTFQNHVFGSHVAFCWNLDCSLDVNDVYCRMRYCAMCRDRLWMRYIAQAAHAYKPYKHQQEIPLRFCMQYVIRSKQRKSQNSVYAY